MAVILVLEDDAATRNGLVDALRQLFTGARVASARSDAAPGIVAVERADVVLASLPAFERLSRGGAQSAVPVVALTREMSPDTLMSWRSLPRSTTRILPESRDQPLNAM